MRVVAFLAVLHFGPWPVGPPSEACAARSVEVKALMAWQGGRHAAIHADAPFQDQDAGGERGADAPPQPTRAVADDFANSEDPASSQGDEAALDTWARERLEDFRRRGVGGVPLEESLAFADELRARDAERWLSEALVHVGYGRMLADELEEALNEWYEAARLGSVWRLPAATARAHNALGVGLQRSGDLVAARNHFELAVYNSPEAEGYGYRVNLASCEMSLGNLGRAFDQFASVLNDLSDAQACVAYYNLSGICHTAELFEAALRLSESCLEKYDLAGEEVQRMAGGAIGVQLMLHHAECLAELGDGEAVQAALAKADALQSEQGGIPSWALGDLLSTRASIALQSDAFEEALEILQPVALELQRHGRPPNSLDPHIQRLLATALKGAGRPREALEVLDQVDPSQVSPGSYLEFDLDELRVSIWGELAQSLAARTTAAGSEQRAPGSGDGAQSFAVPQEREVDRAVEAAWNERRDWRSAERSIIQANFARPELAALLGDLAAIQGRGAPELAEPAANPGEASGDGSARPAAVVALVVAGLLAIGSLVLGLRARQRAEKVLQLEGLVKELRAQRREVADRAAAVSHDLRAPVLALRCCLDLLGLDESSPNVRNRIEPMRKGLDHIIRLADDSLLLHGLVASEDRDLPGACDLVEVLRPVFDLWRPVAARKGLEVDFEVAPGRHLWSIPEDHAVRLLENLLSNAVKFSEGPGRIHVALSTVGGQGELAVEDCGPGLPEDELPRLFEPMARLSTRPTDGEVSSGLGASIVRALVERSGGSVQAENNRSGRGLTVSVRWPAETVDGLSSALPSRARVTPSSSEPGVVSSSTKTDRAPRG